MEQDRAAVLVEGLPSPDQEDLTPMDEAGVFTHELALEDPAILAELVIEEVCIDGMCGVY